MKGGQPPETEKGLALVERPCLSARVMISANFHSNEVVFQGEVSRLNTVVHGSVRLPPEHRGRDIEPGDASRKGR